MALRRQNRNIRKMVGQLVASSWRMARTNFERPVGNYIIEHKSGHAHRAGVTCGLCEKHAKNAVAAIFFG